MTQRPQPMQGLQSTKLQIAIDKARREYGARDILTRSQAELADLVKEMVILEEERDKIAEQRDRTAAQIIDLTLLHEKSCDDVDDIEALIASKRDAIHALEGKGVKLPTEEEHQTAIISDGMRQALAPQGAGAVTTQSDK